MSAFPRIAVTGLGMLSSLGVGREAWLAAVLDGLCPDPVGRMEGFSVAPLLESRKGYLDGHSALALGAMSLALREAFPVVEGQSLRETVADLDCGLMLGSAWGGLGTLDLFFKDVVTKGPRFAKPILFPHTYSNTAAAMGAIEWALRGPHEVFSDGALASANAVLSAVDALRNNTASVMLAGGCEALSPAVSRAFAARYPNAVPGEGAAVLVLERDDSARARHASVLGWIDGIGLSGGSGAEALDLAKREAGVVDAEPVEPLDDLQGRIVGAEFAFGVASALLMPPEDGRSAVVAEEQGLGAVAAVVTAK